MRTCMRKVIAMVSGLLVRCQGVVFLDSLSNRMCEYSAATKWQRVAAITRYTTESDKMQVHAIG